jgi:ubiquitin-protein ligase
MSNSSLLSTALQKSSINQEWHCTLRGPPGTEFEGGLYHFRILLPAEYPFRPPAIMVLTPNGRFELNTKVWLLSTPPLKPSKFTFLLAMTDLHQLHEL